MIRPIPAENGAHTMDPVLNPPEGGGLSLNDILNILWRRKSLIIVISLAGAALGIVYGMLVTPLHLATATVQPGITRYDANALPVREWPIKDIEQWFRGGRYNREMD